jgi:N-acetylmuramoyl-L-alanine amidase
MILPKTYSKHSIQGLYIFLLATTLVFISHVGNAQSKRRATDVEEIIVEPIKAIKCITIDAGHGGKDPGCHGQYSNEKDITLAVALKLEQLIRDFYKNKVRVVQTRSTDIYWTLPERGGIANEAKADLYISIHVNSTPRKQGTNTGTETYVLGLTRTDDKENAITEYGDQDTKEGDLLDINDPLTQIKIAQYTQAFLSQSINLGAKIENEFMMQGRDSKGVKQKSLGVLAHSGMPGVLVEIGFLNNPAEEAYLNSEQGIAQVAEAIFNGIKAYKLDYEKVIIKQ